MHKSVRWVFGVRQYHTAGIRERYVSCFLSGFSTQTISISTIQVDTLCGVYNGSKSHKMGLYSAAQWCQLVTSCLDWANDESILVRDFAQSASSCNVGLAAALPLMRWTVLERVQLAFKAVVSSLACVPCRQNTRLRQRRRNYCHVSTKSPKLPTVLYDAA
jgi:hypothetical protein